MIWRLIIRKRSRGTLISEAIAATFAIFVVGPIAWLAFDNTPPWVRISGTIEPTHAGGLIRAHWKTTPLTRRCPGTIQIEIISGDDTAPLIWPVLSRPAQTGVSDDIKLGQTSWEPPLWPLSHDVPPGQTIYRVTSFWYCNFVQTFLDAPITQVGPDLTFTTLPAEKSNDVR